MGEQTSSPAATSPSPRPAALRVLAAQVPAQLVAMLQWVGWDWVWDAARGEWAKVPRHPRTGGHASATNPGAWTDFDTALAAMTRHAWAGIGFVVTRDDPFTGVDLDRCRDPRTGALDAWAAEIVAALNSYTEVTPSGTGVRVWVIGTLIGRLPDGKEGTRRGPVEIYSGSRYFTVTGHRLDADRS